MCTDADANDLRMGSEDRDHRFDRFTGAGDGIGLVVGKEDSRGEAMQLLFVDGVDARLQFLCPCQKQPLTKIIVLYLDKTMSGDPGNFF